MVCDEADILQPGCSKVVVTTPCNTLVTVSARHPPTTPQPTSVEGDYQIGAAPALYNAKMAEALCKCCCTFLLAIARTDFIRFGVKR